MTGKTETTFAPDASMTRAEGVEALYRMAGLPDVSGLSEPFWDVSDSTQSSDVIIWAVENGVISVSGSWFRPLKAATRAEIAYGIMRTDIA